MTPHLVHVFPSFEAGGAQLRIAGVINHLAGRMRHTVVALNGNFGAKYRVGEGLAEFQAAPKRRDPLRSLVDLRGAIRSLSPDLLVTYNWGSIDAILSSMPAPAFPILHNECGFSDAAELQKRRRLWTRKFALNRIHKTLVTSQTMLEISRRYFGVSGERLQFIQTGVDTDRFQPGGNPVLRRELGVSDNEVLFGSLSALRPEKGLDLMVEGFAASGMKSAALVFFGTGSEQARLEQIAKQSGARVMFAGHRQDSPECFRAMDVFLMSSLTEQTPNALLEAMATGLPAVCTDVGDTGHLLGEEQAGYVLKERDPAAYAACLRRLAEDVALRQRLGQGNRARSVDRFPIGRMLDEYVEAYRTALASGVVPR